MKFNVLEFNDRLSWLNWRHSGIGSSDACVIMGVSRFKKYNGLLLEKRYPFSGEDQANTYIKERGNKIEIQVREFLETKYSTTFKPMNCEAESIPFFKVSLDGITPDHKIITEIKLLSTVNPAKINTEAAGYKKWEAATTGVVPDEYYPQIQHQLMITGAEKCLFVGYKEVRGEPVTEDKLAIIEVWPKLEYIRVLALEEMKFWIDKELPITTYEGELE